MTQTTVDNERLRTKVRILQASLAVEKDQELSIDKARKELEVSELAREAI